MNAAFARKCTGIPEFRSLLYLYPPDKTKRSFAYPLQEPTSDRYPSGRMATVLRTWVHIFPS